MAKIIYLPLDERPCNLYYPQQLANMTDLHFTAPDKNMLGNKKNPADFEVIAEWLLKECHNADYLIVSLDMLTFGGIVPSRIHTLTREECIRRMEVIRIVKQKNPQLKVYAFDLVMRVPSYNSDDEEPTYYEEYGSRIHEFGALSDKKNLKVIKKEELNRFAKLETELPTEMMEDYLTRRQINHEINHYSINLVNEGIIQTLVIPLDDNAEYGFSASEQRSLMLKVAEHTLYDQVFIYPGADEVGCSLLSRVFCDVKQYKPKIASHYSSTKGPFVIPALEDRSLSESIKAQIHTAGGVSLEESNDYDIALMVNSAPIGQSDMAEYEEFEKRNRAYFNEIHYMSFLEKIKVLHENNKFIALADVATINGSDRILMELLTKTKQIDLISAYAGWNTSGNTLGTVIAHAIIKSFYQADIETDLFLYHRYIEDWAYQSIIRNDITVNTLEKIGANYFDITNVEKEVIDLAEVKITEFLNHYLPTLADSVIVENIYFPWKRMFEIDFDLSIR